MGGERETLTPSAVNNLDAGHFISADLDAVALSADLDLISGFYRTHLCTDVKQKLVQGSVHDDDAADNFLIDCSVLSIEIENEIITILNHIREIYRGRFVDLERFVPRPIDYALAVKRLESEPGPRAPDISTIVGAISRISIGPDRKEEPMGSLSACDQALALDSARKKLLDFVGKRTELAAPNLSALVGAVTAAKLIGAAGGLKELSDMPYVHLLRLGSRMRKGDGFKSADCKFDDGRYLAQADVVQEYSETPARKEFFPRLARYVYKAADLDLSGEGETGAAGRDMAKEARLGFEGLKMMNDRRRRLEGRWLSSENAGSFPIPGCRRACPRKRFRVQSMQLDNEPPAPVAATPLPIGIYKFDVEWGRKSNTQH